MKRMFKSTISLLLIAAFLLTPLASTTASAVGEISANDTATKVESTNSGYSYGNYILPDAVIPNPDYVPPEENVQTSNTASSTATENGRLADGVYWIRNMGNGGKHIDTNGGGVTTGTKVVQWEQSIYINGDENSYNRNQLFKVTYLNTVNGYDYYTIRPMTNNGLGLSAPKNTSSDLVDVQTMSTTEVFADIPWYQKWAIVKEGDFYYIENHYVDGQTYLASPGDSNNGSQLIMSDTQNWSSFWVFELYTGPSIDGMIMSAFDPSMEIGESFRCKAIVFSSTIGRNGAPRYTVEDREGGSTYRATIGSTSGLLRAKDSGAIRVATTYTNAPWIWLWNARINVDLIAQEKSLWCWAATTKMFARNYYTGLTYTQTDAAIEILGSNENEGVNILQAMEAINYYVSEVNGSLDLVYNYHQVYTQDNLIRFIDDGHVIYASRGYYASNGSSYVWQSGHAILIYDYYWENGICWFKIRDPLPVDEGTTVIMSYKKLYNGLSTENGEVADSSVWDKAIVVRTSYSSDTVASKY